MGLRSEGKEIDGLKRENKIRKHALNGNLQKCFTKSNKKAVKTFMMKSSLHSP
jgi:hypothetical protein